MLVYAEAFKGSECLILRLYQLLYLLLLLIKRNRVGFNTENIYHDDHVADYLVYITSDMYSMDK